MWWLLLLLGLVAAMKYDHDNFISNFKSERRHSDQATIYERRLTDRTWVARK